MRSFSLAIWTFVLGACAGGGSQDVSDATAYTAEEPDGAGAAGDSDGGRNSGTGGGGGGGGGAGRIDAAPLPDAAPTIDAVVTGEVACGAVVCPVGQGCCTVADYSGYQHSCSLPRDACALFATCDGPEDCGGDRCCGIGTASSGDTGVLDAQCQGGGINTCGHEVCHQPSDCSQAGYQCCRTQFGKGLCKPQC